jgi:hypothetical protein
VWTGGQLEEGAKRHLDGTFDPLAHPPAEGIRVTGHLDGDGGHSVFGDSGQNAPQSGHDHVIQH